jgi:hypothetical protein
MALQQLIPVASASKLEQEEQTRKDAEKRQNSPFIQSLAAHAKKRW